MNNRCKLVIALGAGALVAPFGSFAQQQTSTGALESLFFQSAINQNISYPGQNSAADVSFLKELADEANSMLGKSAYEVARIAKALQEKLDSVQMDLLLVRLNSNPDYLFRFAVLEQIRATRAFTRAALAQATTLKPLATPSLRPDSAPTR